MTFGHIFFLCVKFISRIYAFRGGVMTFPCVFKLGKTEDIHIAVIWNNYDFAQYFLLRKKTISRIYAIGGEYDLCLGFFLKPGVPQSS